MGVLKTSDHMKINIRMQNPCQERSVSSKAQNQDLKDLDVFCTFWVEIENQNLDHVCSKDQWPYSNEDQDAKPQSRTSRILQSPKQGLKGHGCSLHLQNQDRGPKFKSWLYQKPVTLSKSRSRCQTPVMNFQHPPKPKMRTEGTWMFFAPLKSRERAENCIMVVSKTSDHIQIRIKMPNPSHELPASSEVPNQDLKDMGIICLHLQNQDREPISWSWLYQTPVTISKSKLICQTPVMNLQCPLQPQMRT